LPEHGGCPEVLPGSDDGVVLGSGTSDSDGDGASDDADPCPTEAGSPENGYCPPPREDPAPSEEEPVFEFPLLFFQAFAVSDFVEFEALHFEVSRHYHEIWCYAKLADGDVERYEFDPGPGQQWDIAEALGGENSVHLALTQSDPVDVFVECYGKGSFFDIRPDYLGSITGRHASQEWDGHVIDMESTGGDPGGHSFQVRYHLCSPSCEANALQPPVITRYTTTPDKRIHLEWDWEGDRRSIEGFKLYLNGNFFGAYPREESRMSWRYDRAYCVDRWEFTMTTYGGPDAEHPDIESSPGNTVVFEDLPCEKSIRVTFGALNAHNVPEDEWGEHTLGPLYGTFNATAGANMESVGFDAVHCAPIPVPPFEQCWGHRISEGSSYTVQDFLDWVHREQDECGSGLCHADHYSASASDTVTIRVNPGDELTIAARIMDADKGPGDADDVLFEERATIDTDDLSPDSTFTLTIPGEHLDLTVLIDLFPFDP
jgi:hypothetical protein